MNPTSTSFASRLLMSRRLITTGYIAIIHFLTVTTVYAQDMVLPVDIQFQLFSRILSFNRAIPETGNADFVIIVLYQKSVRYSFDTKDQILQLSSLPKIGRRSVRVQAVSFERESDLETALAATTGNAVYIAPLRSVDISKVIGVSQRRGLLTLTGVPDYVDRGASVGIGVRGEKPLVIINLASAKAVGADFSSQLLSIAKVIQ
jgi:hypothetical protein